MDLAAVLERFGCHRLLTFDRDPSAARRPSRSPPRRCWENGGGYATGSTPTAPTCAGHASLTASITEWQATSRDPDYLLTGSRLAAYEAWSQQSTLRLTAIEQAFLDASRQRRRAEQEQAAPRRAREARLKRRARSRLWALLGAVTLLAAATALVASRPPDVALVFVGRGHDGSSQMIAAGFDQAVADFALVAEEVAPVSEARLRVRRRQRLRQDIIDGRIVVPTEPTG